MESYLGLETHDLPVDQWGRRGVRWYSDFYRRRRRKNDSSHSKIPWNLERKNCVTPGWRVSKEETRYFCGKNTFRLKLQSEDDAKTSLRMHSS